MASQTAKKLPKQPKRDALLTTVGFEPTPEDCRFTMKYSLRQRLRPLGHIALRCAVG